MNCPECGAKSEVIDSRWAAGSKIDGRVRLNQQTTRRRRSCPNGHRFTTYETLINESVASLLDQQEERLRAIEGCLLAMYVNHAGQTADHIREIAGLTKDEVACASGISPKAIQKIFEQWRIESGSAQTNLLVALGSTVSRLVTARYDELKASA